MTLRGDAVARLFLKTAASGAGKSVGAALRLAGKGAKAGIRGAGDFGAGVAEGLGADQTIGRVVGMGTAGAAGLSAAGGAKRKVDEWRYRNGLYSGY